MGKVVLFAVLTMDGCLTDSSGEAQKWLAKTETPDRFGIAELKETARPLSEYTSLTMLVLDKTTTTYFIAANATTASIINGMARMHLLDEIILCTIPVIARKRMGAERNKGIQGRFTESCVSKRM